LPVRESAHINHSGTTQLTLLIGRAWRQIGRQCARAYAEYRSRSAMTRSGEGLGAVPLDTLSGPAAVIGQAPG
jgi:hypothetical protein